jgi:hypothetical protein
LVPTPVPRKKSVMSRRRHGVLLMKYSDVPSRKRRRVIVTSPYCERSIAGREAASSSSSSSDSSASASSWRDASDRPTFSKVSETSAMPAAERVSEPPKMTSSMALPRRCFADCSPMHQRMASMMFDLPQPFGPTTAVIGSSIGQDGLVIERLEAEDLDSLDPHGGRPSGPGNLTLRVLHGTAVMIGTISIGSG